MQKLTFITAVLLAWATSSVHADATVVFSDEVSTILSSKQFAAAFERVRSRVDTGTELQMSGVNLYEIGDKTFYTVPLKIRVLAIEPPRFTALGEIAGELEYAPTLRINSAYFKSLPQAP